MENSGGISNFLHSLPHMNATFSPVSDHYVHGDKDYEAGVRTLSFIPVFIILLLLLILLAKLWLQMSFIPRNALPSTYCRCGELRWMSRLTKICILLVLLAMLAELVILILGLMAFKKHVVKHNIIDNIKYGNKLDALAPKLLDQFKKHLSPLESYIILDEQATFILGVYRFSKGKSLQNTPAYVYDSKWASGDCYYTRDFKKILRNDTVRPYRKLYAKFQTELQAAWLNIMRPSVAPREVKTYFQRDLLQFTLVRFVKSMICWCIALIILFCKPHRYWFVALLGVIWCCVAAASLMKSAVKAADICQYPELFMHDVINLKKLQSYMMVQHYYFCEEFLHHSSMAKRRIRDIYYKWGAIFNKTADKVKAEYDIVQEANYKSDNRYCYAKRAAEYITHHTNNFPKQLNVKYMKCRGQKVEDPDLPHDDIYSLCNHDAVVKWLFLQLLLVLLLALLLLIMLTIQLSRHENVANYRRRIEYFRQKFILKSRAMTVGILNEKRLYPTPVPPGECYKTCKQYKREQRAKSFFAGKLAEYDEKEKAAHPEKDPFAKYPPPLMPICSLRRANPCCEPVQQEPLYEQAVKIVKKKCYSPPRDGSSSS